MTRPPLTLGAGTLYVDGKPYAAVRDLRVEFDEAPPRFDKVPLDPDAFTATCVIPGVDVERLNASVARAVQMHREWENAEVLRMLGEWVSGLEPCLLLDQRTGQLRGLTIADLPGGVIAPIVVAARERACRVCGCTELRACVVDRRACYWVGADLCSACA